MIHIKLHTIGSCFSLIGAKSKICLFQYNLVLRVFGDVFVMNSLSLVTSWVQYGCLMATNWLPWQALGRPHTHKSKAYQSLHRSKRFQPTSNSGGIVAGCVPSVYKMLWFPNGSSSLESLMRSKVDNHSLDTIYTKLVWKAKCVMVMGAPDTSRRSGWTWLLGVGAFGGLEIFLC